MPTGGTGAKDVSAIIPQFDAYAEKTFQQSGVPGMAVAVVKDDKVVYLRCFGVKNTTTREPVTPDTWFQIASISKSFTSASIAAINPGFRLSDPWMTEHVTFRDLLSHRTGLTEYATDEPLENFGYNRSEI